MDTTKFVNTQLAASIRFVDGYRYLDRWGETVIRLKKALMTGWIAGDANPQAAPLRNYDAGLRMSVSSHSMVLEQHQFVQFEVFQTEFCKAFEIIVELLAIRSVLVPTLRVFSQLGTESMDQSEEVIKQIRLNTYDTDFLATMEGTNVANSLTICTDKEINNFGIPATRKRRCEVASIRQEQQPDFDKRIMSRLSLVPFGDHEALRALMTLRRGHPTISQFAAQIDAETMVENAEFRINQIDLKGFTRESFDWTERLRTLCNSRLDDT